MRGARFIAAVFAICVLTPATVRAQSCEEQPVVAAAIEQVKAIGRNNPSWLAKVGLWVPYFRMNDVAFSVVSVRTKGTARTGLDCEMVVRMAPPADIPDAKTVQATFGFIIMSRSGGGFDIDLY